PSPAARLMFSTLLLAGGGVFTGAAVNVHVARSSASATALPASSGESKTTLGHSIFLPDEHGGMLVIVSFVRPAPSVGRSAAFRPMPTGSRAKGSRVPKRVSRVGWT